MGSQAAFSVTLFGHTISFLEVEPTVYINGPTALTADTTPGVADGAQAFNIPMLFGVRVTPIDGIGLPGLSEMRYPVVLTTADSEVSTNSNYQRISGGLPNQMGYARTWQTAQHVNAFTTTSQSLTAKADIPLGTIGIVQLSLGLSFPTKTGDLTVNTDRLIDLTSAFALTDYPHAALPHRVGWLFPSTSGLVGYHEGAWQPNSNCGGGLCGTAWAWGVEPEGYTDPYTAGNAYFRESSVTAGPMDARARQDDDHSVRGATSFGVGLALQAALGTPDGCPFTLQVQASGGINGNVEVDHIVREGVFAEQLPRTNQFLPTTGLVVRPRTYASVTLGGAITLKLGLNIGWFGTVEWDNDLYSTPTVLLASYDTENTHSWPDASSLRLGTGSPSGTPMTSPVVHSLHPFKSASRVNPISWARQRGAHRHTARSDRPKGDPRGAAGVATRGCLATRGPCTVPIG